MLYPEASAVKSTRPPASGDLAQHSTGHTFAGFAVAPEGEFSAAIYKMVLQLSQFCRLIRAAAYTGCSVSYLPGSICQTCPRSVPGPYPPPPSPFSTGPAPSPVQSRPPDDLETDPCIFALNYPRIAYTGSGHDPHKPHPLSVLKCST